MANNNFTGLGLGLLKFCLEHSDGNVGDTNMENYQRDREDYKWLMEALNNLESDAQRMKKLVESLNGDTTTQQMKYALEGIQYFVEDLDLANDLIKVNGLQPIVNLVSHDDADIRLWAAWIVASVSQNHPTTQLALVKLDILSHLCKAIQKETSDEVKDKQLYALSSVTSGNQSLMDQFVDDYNGIPYLVALTVAKSPSTQFKAIWFLYKLLSGRDRNLLIAKQDDNLVNNLMNVISESEKLETRERAVQILGLYLKNDANSLQKCKSLGLDQVILERLSKATDEEKTLLESLHNQLK